MVLVGQAQGVNVRGILSRQFLFVRVSRTTAASAVGTFVFFLNFLFGDGGVRTGTIPNILACTPNVNVAVYVWAQILNA
jgi:hypothetical protein